MRNLAAVVVWKDKYRRNWGETLTELFTGDGYHVAGIVDDTENEEIVIEATVDRGVVETPLQKYRNSKDTILIINPTFLSINQRQLIVERWKKDIGMKYDKGNILGKIFRLSDITNSKHKRICSELIAKGHEDIWRIWGKNPARVTPNDYLTFSYMQNERKFDVEVLK